MSLPWLLTEHALSAHEGTAAVRAPGMAVGATTAGVKGGAPIPAPAPSVMFSDKTDSAASLLSLFFAPLAAYDAAAVVALRTHKQQHIYAEVEAEVNLCFDQILFEVSERVHLALIDAHRRPASRLACAAHARKRRPNSSWRLRAGSPHTPATRPTTSARRSTRTTRAGPRSCSCVIFSEQPARLRQRGTRPMRAPSIMEGARDRLETQ